MLISTWLIPAAALALAAQAPGSEAVEKFEGTWKVAAMERNGESAPSQELEGMEVVFKGETFRLKGGDVTYHGTFVVDPKSSPAQITTFILDDSAGTDDTKQAERMRRLGIYKFEGESLSICLDETGESRPESFETEGKEGFRMFKLTRKE